MTYIVLAIIYSCNMTLNFAIKYFLVFDNTYSINWLVLPSIFLITFLWNCYYFEQGKIDFRVFLLMFLKILDHSYVVPDLNKLQKITHLTFNYHPRPTDHAMTKVRSQTATHQPCQPKPAKTQHLYFLTVNSQTFKI